MHVCKWKIDCIFAISWQLDTCTSPECSIKFSAGPSMVMQPHTFLINSISLVLQRAREKKMWTIQFNIAICSCFQIGFLCTRQIYGSKTARIQAKKLVLSIFKIELKNFRIKNIECNRLQIRISSTKWHFFTHEKTWQQIRNKNIFFKKNTKQPNTSSFHAELFLTCIYLLFFSNKIHNNVCI